MTAAGRRNLKSRVKHVRECPECGGATVNTQDDLHEVVCGSCGYVVDRPLGIVAEDDKWGRAPTHPLLWSRNLGSPESAVLQSLKKAGILKSLSARDLRTDDSYVVYAMEALAKKLMQHNLDFGETARVARALRRRLKQLTRKDRVEFVVDEVYNEFLGEKRRLLVSSQGEVDSTRQSPSERDG